MNLSQLSSLRTIVDQVNKTANLPYVMDSYQIETIWKMAVMYNKRQNRMLASGDNTDIVRSFHVLDEESKNIIQVNVRAGKNYSRNQWFKMLFAERCFYTSQMFRKFIIPAK